MTLPPAQTCIIGPHETGMRAASWLGRDPNNSCFGPSTDRDYAYVFVQDTCNGSPGGCGARCI
jgi:hypothetical protein